MPKRNTTEEVLSSISQGDIDANAAKAAQLAKIPDPVWMAVIDRALTFSDRVMNTRDEDSGTYKFEENKGLYHSLKEKGLEKRGDPMTFHLEPDGRYKVLVGNLRSSMMDVIDNEERDRRVKAGEPADPTTLPFARIFGLVYSGLSHGQQVAIMADHIGRKDLNEYEKCKEIGELMEQNGLTDAQGSVHFGMDKNKVRRYRMRWAMPTVMAEFKKEKAGKDANLSYISIGQKQLDKLHAAYLTDRESGNRHRQEGPAFRLVWDAIKADPTLFRTGGPKETGPESLDVKTLQNQAASSVALAGNGFEIIAIADTLRFASGDKTVNMNSVRDTAKDEADKLRAEVSRIGKERDDLALMVESLRAENEALPALRTENEALKARLKKNGK